MSRATAAAARRRSVASVDPTLKQTIQNTSVVNGTTLVLTTTANIAVGDLIVIAATRGTITGDVNTITSVVVSAGATDGFGDTAQACRASTYDLHLEAARCTTLIPSGSTITITYASSSGKRAAIAAVFDQVTTKTAETTSGITGIGGDGGTSAGPNGNSLTPSATALTVNTTARHLVVGASSIGGGRTSTPGSGYTEIAEAQTTSGSGDKGVVMEWKFATAVATETAANTQTSSAVWAAVVATWPCTA